MIAKHHVWLVVCLLAGTTLTAQERLQNEGKYWQIGIGLGELPLNGSFKPSITLGYHFGPKFYTGIIYQFKDAINRDASSFNARSTDLSGLTASSEKVAQRFLLQLRYKPVRNGPYISTGVVFNGTDQETMLFDSRTRNIVDDYYEGDIQIIQTRPAGWGLALGLGYQYDFNNGLSAGFEWTPAWGQYPVPEYAFSGSSSISSEAKKELTHRMNKGFRSSVTNLYKVFHIGFAYRWN